MYDVHYTIALYNSTCFIAEEEEGGNIFAVENT